MCAARRIAPRDLIAFRNQILDGEVQVGKCGQEHCGKLLFGLGTTHLRGVGIMTDVVGGHPLVDDCHILAVPEFNPAPDECLVFLRGHGSTSCMSSSQQLYNCVSTKLQALHPTLHLKRLTVW